MADRRMLTRKVTDDDNFLTLSASAQALYLHLSMCADDDGFCNQVAISMFKAHASVADLEALLSRRYIYQFQNGVIVIKHWRMANALRKDRYTPTAFKEELAQLRIKDNGAYTMVAERLPDGCQMVAERLPQDSIGKDRIDKDRIGKDKLSNESTRPTLEEVKVFALENQMECDPEEFFDYYSANGWKVGKSPMKDWKAALRNWNRRDGEFSKKPKKKTYTHQMDDTDRDFERL